MILSGDTSRENLTLSEADLVACRPIVGEGGHVLRALCPFHETAKYRGEPLKQGVWRRTLCA
jgi:hypothetical protein